MPKSESITTASNSATVEIRCTVATRRARRSIGSVVALAAASAYLVAPLMSDTIQGCQGSPTTATVVSKPTLAFVWPCYAAADTFLEEDPREAELLRDREMRAQFLRLREDLKAGGVELLEASGAIHLDHVGPKASVEKIRTTTVDWRGVLVLCPGQKSRRIDMRKRIAPDAQILDAARGCGPSSDGKAKVAAPN